MTNTVPSNAEGKYNFIDYNPPVGAGFYRARE